MFYNIRVIRASSKTKAIRLIEDGKFDETHPLNDNILNHGELRDALFPNGFESWIETHYEVVQAITNEWMKDEPEGIVKKVQDEQGHGGLYLLAQTLTDEFERKFKSCDWNELNFFDEINDFLNKKLR